MEIRAADFESERLPLSRLSQVAAVVCLGYAALPSCTRL